MPRMLDPAKKLVCSPQKKRRFRFDRTLSGSLLKPGLPIGRTGRWSIAFETCIFN